MFRKRLPRLFGNCFVVGRDKFRRNQHQIVKVNDLEPIAALSNINSEHTAILQALTIKKPTLPTQLTLL